MSKTKELLPEAKWLRAELFKALFSKDIQTVKEIKAEIFAKYSEDVIKELEEWAMEANKMTDEYYVIKVSNCQDCATAHETGHTIMDNNGYFACATCLGTKKVTTQVLLTEALEAIHYEQTKDNFEFPPMEEGQTHWVVGGLENKE